MVCYSDDICICSVFCNIGSLGNALSKNSERDLMTYDSRVGERLVLIEKHLEKRNDLLKEQNRILDEIRKNLEDMI